MLLIACQSLSGDEWAALARRKLAAGNAKAAIVHLEKGLQQDAESGPRRLLFRQARLDMGDAEGASAEPAELTQHPQQRALEGPLLGQAMIAKGDAHRFIDQHRGTDLATTAASAELKAVLAGADTAVGRPQPARAPASAAIRRAQTWLLLRADQVADARALVEAVHSSAPGNVEGWRLLGDLRTISNDDPVGAAQAYRHALSLKKGDIGARSSVSALRM